MGVRQGVLALYERLQPFAHFAKKNINAKDGFDNNSTVDNPTLGTQEDGVGDKNVQNITDLLRFR